MEKFLKLNSEFLEEYNFLQKIINKIVFKTINPLETHLSSIKLDVFKALISKDFYNSEKLKKTYREIIKEEANEVEKMIFKLVLNEKLGFNDINLKFLFYKNFPSKKHLFYNINTDFRFEIADLIFNFVYFKSENKSEEIISKLQNIIKDLPMQAMIFYFLVFKDIIDILFVKNILLSVKQTYFLEYWILGLTCFPEPEFYKILSSELLNADFVKKVRIYRVIENFIDQTLLFDNLLKEAMKNILTVKKMYINFLNLLELFKLNFDYKMKYLCYWMRYFIYNKFYDDFEDLLHRIEKFDLNKELHNDIKFFQFIKTYLNKDLSYEELEKLINELEDSKKESEYNFKNIILQLKN